MFTFKDPNEFEAIPPVPDIKAWLNEFRHKHPHSINNQQNDSIRMEFEKMKIHNNTVQETNESLKRELFKSHSKIQQLEMENSSLKQQNETQFIEIKQLKQEMKQLQENNNNNNINDENNNSLNEINWNFNINNNGNNNGNSRKRARSESEENEQYMKKAKISKSGSISRGGSMDISLQHSDILERRLSTNLDLIRGDILAEAGCEDQVIFCFNMLKKCSTDEWQLRNFLMQMICGLSLENKYINYSIIWDSRHIIKKQLTDLRSAIVKTTCEMLIIFSKYCDKIKFGQCLSFFIPTHLQGLYVTIACIRDAHNQCLSQCINNTQSFKCITPLLKGLQNKHSEVRVKVINLLSSLIISYSSSGNNHNNMDKKFEKYADAIGNTIKTYLADSKPLVRAAVKKLFENFAVAFPSRAKSLLSRMDSNHQKTLRKCIGNNNHSKTQKRQTSSGYGQIRTRRK